MHVTLRHLRAALAVARHSSFRRAAEELHLSQPALSSAVGELERNLGVVLFDRTSRMVCLTEMGQPFLADVARLVGDLDRLLHNVSDLTQSRRGRVVVTCLSSVAGRAMPNVLRECDRRYPSLEVVIRDDVATKVLEVVRLGEADFGLTVAPNSAQPGLTFEPLFEEAFEVICTKMHHFRHKKKLTWKDLSGQDFIAFSTTSGSHAPIDAEIVRQGVCFNRVVTGSQLATVTGMLEAGLGIGILPGLALPVADHPSLIHRPLTDPTLTRTIGVIRRKDHSLSPAATALHEILQTSLKPASQ